MPMLLPVPYISQWGQSANHVRTDCGVACVLMVAQYFGKAEGLTVDDLSADTTLPHADVGLMPAALVTLGLKHGLTTYVKGRLTLDDIKREIDADRPVIVLVHYRFISGKLDPDNSPLNDGHFLCIVGYDDTHVVANDPDYWAPYTNRGSDVLIPIAEIEQAMGSYGSIGVLAKERQDMNPREQLQALLSQTQSLLAQAQNVAGQIPDPVPQLPPSGTFPVRVLSSGTNLRSAPLIPTIGQPSNVVAVFDKDTILNVMVAKDSSGNPINASGHLWYAVFKADNSIQGYIAQEVVSKN